MSTFIEYNDYLAVIKDRHLKQVLEDDLTLLDLAEDTAVAIVRDALHTRYDVDAIFNSTGADRPRQVMRWVKTIALYLVHERIPDRVVPERIVSDYERTMDILRDIEDGKMSVDLPRIQDDEGADLTKFRWGSRPARGHDID